MTINCRSGCGVTMADEAAAIQAGWWYLQITRGWRCPSCDRELLNASSLVGTADETTDTLDPNSRGALPKETASTILPPTVPRG